jgi:hypothetical protein
VLPLHRGHAVEQVTEMGLAPDAGNAQDCGAVVADQLAREADQDRRQGREPRPLHRLSDGRGRGAATDVPGYPLADRPAAGAARTSMTERRGQMQQAATAEVRLDEGNATGSGGERRANRRFGREHRQLRSNCVAARLDETKHYAQRAGNPGNVR